MGNCLSQRCCSMFKRILERTYELSSSRSTFSKCQSNKVDWKRIRQEEFNFVFFCRRCWINYVDYHRCMESKNDEKVCGYFKHLYKDLCPEEWVNKWDDEMDRGVFPGIHS